MTVLTDIKHYFIHHPIDSLAYFFILLVGMVFLPFLAIDSFWFSDDSPAYLLLAKAFSPYFNYSDIILEGAKKENYPPLFPMFLALLGASNSLAYAHVLVGCCFIIGLIAVYRFATIIFEDKRYALLSLVFFCLSPGVFRLNLGFLSEPLYIALSLFILYYLKDWHNKVDDTRYCIFLTLLLTCALLTRSIGISLLGAMGMVQLIQQRNLRFLTNVKIITVLLSPGLVALLWHYLRPVLGESLYQGYVVETSKSIFNNPVELIRPQLVSLVEAWHSIMHIFWTSIFSPVYIISSIVGVIAAAVLVIRIRQNKLDAWYLTIYLIIITIWPHPIQQVRFLYPIYPILLIYFFLAFQFLQFRFSQQKLARQAYVFSALLISVITIPAMFFIYSRIQDAYSVDAKRSTLITYYHPNRDIALFNSRLHEQLQKDMKRIGDSLAQTDIVLWYVPKYMYLIAERRSLKIPKIDDRIKFLRQVANSQAQFVYVSRFHPWNGEFADFPNYLAAVENIGEVVWNTQVYDHRTANQLPFGTLFKLDQKKIAQVSKLEK